MSPSRRPYYSPSMRRGLECIPENVYEESDQPLAGPSRYNVPIPRKAQRSTPPTYATPTIRAASRSDTRTFGGRINVPQIIVTRAQSPSPAPSYLSIPPSKPTQDRTLLTTPDAGRLSSRDNVPHKRDEDRWIRVESKGGKSNRNSTRKVPLITPQADMGTCRRTHRHPVTVSIVPVDSDDDE
ncbi:hypothetical protein GLOTRDRAFT_109547 [Gloeophyllum trabeum ATCC 11539]|uniref:Uncharacterized protein n=1 Tax=Gloeophyllum trabeum (strain ATCC 11539 / FP-39264 / Madison 617) TaxID=670483 RepID=S7QH43_GLOTA|nr:uncharacterized protein GLOTRDRAFT_109547 [Gloeophyllum trabeum ATCC 11539]EPQ59116.1 hypothetical protein GLOTRDRAFT_109547 [Gloeophyllum trabeum ATCC 11539]